MTGFLVRESLRSLKGNWFRSILTMLGVIIGVAAVIAMMSIGGGAREEAVEQIRALGSKNLYVKASRLSGTALEEARQKQSQGLTPYDVDQILQDIQQIEAASFETTWDVPVKVNGTQPRATLLAVGDDYFQVVPTPLKFGRPFVTRDFTWGSRVALLGEELATELFGNIDPSGQLIELSDQRFEIIGVIANQKKKSRSVQGNNGGNNIQDREPGREVILPWPSLTRRIMMSYDSSGDSDKDPTYHWVQTLILKLKNDEDMPAVRDMVENLLKFRHRGVNDFEIIAPLDLLAKSQKVQDIFNLVMIFIASLSLVVGGIGIMNIMLANIQQRIKEIGIRMAIGARTGDILTQFLLEAVLISVGGGLIGILVGIGISEAIATYTGWRTVLSPMAVVISFGVSVAVGLFFGYFPAQRAAELDPIEALRHD